MRLVVFLLISLWPAIVAAGPWTRDRGHFFLGLSYSRISADRLVGADGVPRLVGSTYTQHALGLYSEIGLHTRWLTASVEWQGYRDATLSTKAIGADSFVARTAGIGDLRMGLWSGLVTRPVRFTLALLWSFPIGDPTPEAGRSIEGERDPARRALISEIARTLPTGDGEVDFELRGSFGHSFGGWRRWPLQHYLVAEAGYWLRTSGFPDDVTFRLELGVKLPFRFIDRFWFSGRIAGIEAILSPEDLAAGGVCERASAWTGLGPCVSYVGYGFDIFGRIFHGFGASIGLDSALHTRLVPARPSLRLGVSYEY